MTGIEEVCIKAYTFSDYGMLHGTPTFVSEAFMYLPAVCAKIDYRGHSCVPRGILARIRVSRLRPLLYSLHYVDNL